MLKRIEGLIETNRNNYELAFRLFDVSEELSRDINDVFGLAETRLFKGEAHIKVSEIQTARVLFQDAVELYERLGAKVELNNIKYKLSMLNLH